MATFVIIDKEDNIKLINIDHILYMDGRKSYTSCNDGQDMTIVHFDDGHSIDIPISIKDMQRKLAEAMRLIDMNSEIV